MIPFFYRCLVCDKSFNNKGNRDRHLYNACPRYNNIKTEADQLESLENEAASAAADAGPDAAAAEGGEGEAPKEEQAGPRLV